MTRLVQLRRACLTMSITIAVLLAARCGRMKQQADAQFGDQNFKTAIALIELYHVRHGTYPNALTDLDFTGQWDPIALSGVQYRRLLEGYELNVTRGWVGKPTLTYPPAFWQGLGIRQTNVGRRGPTT